MLIAIMGAHFSFTFFSPITTLIPLPSHHSSHHNRKGSSHTTDLQPKRFISNPTNRNSPTFFDPRFHKKELLPLNPKRKERISDSLLQLAPTGPRQGPHVILPATGSQTPDAPCFQTQRGFDPHPIPSASHPPKLTSDDLQIARPHLIKTPQSAPDHRSFNRRES